MNRKSITLIVVMLSFISLGGKIYGQTGGVSAPILLSPQTNKILGANDTALVWQSVAGANSYRVHIAIDSTYFMLVLVDTTVVSDTTLSLKNYIGTDLRVGGKFYWRVRASGSSGSSDYSEVWSFIAAQVGKFIPGSAWYDTGGHSIQAHGGGILYDDSSGTYYWYGEDRSASGYHAIGVSCYSSKDLYSWKFEGVVLPSSATNSTGMTPVLERPKVIYNDSTKKYVMWMHIDYSDYSLANAGVAVSDSPTGPFEYLGNERPNNAMSRDMTLFKDDNGKAYLFSSSENNATMYVSLLTGDYLHQSGTYKRNLVNNSREAPAVFKSGSKYYMITSGTSGWAPNEARYATANSPLGPWILSGNPCVGQNADITFGGQSTYVLPVSEKPGKYIFMADKWNPSSLVNSTYIWLPLQVDNSKVVIQWYQTWDLSIFDETVGVNDHVNVLPFGFSLSQNYPNPFNPTTTINYSIPAIETNQSRGDGIYTTLKVYDVLGREVTTLVNERKSPGSYQVEFNAGGISSGIYFYQLHAGDFVSTMKMILMK